MDYTVKEVLQFVRENDVKFVRLAFCDIFGTLKNISVMAEEMERAFEEGVTFDASAVKGFMNVEQSDLLLFPDPATLVVLPWRPQQGRVVRLLCDIRHPDGTFFQGDGRQILRSTAGRAAEQGFACMFGSECEFYLFEADDKGRPTDFPQDFAGYLDVAPLDKGENVRREICLTLEEMGVRPESSHHEQGPGQNEIDFKYSDALKAADDLITFKTVVKAVAARNGLYASFMPRPLPYASGSGLHVNMSLFRDGRNQFRGGGEHSRESESFIAGVLDRVRECSAFFNPLTNSYSRLGRFEAPRYVTWSHQNRSQLVRIPAAKGEKLRMEVRSPDPACNPYMAFSLLLSAGMEGIENGKPLCPPCNKNLYTASPEELAGVDKLPDTLLEAIGLAENSRFIKRVLPEETVEKYLGEKRAEWQRFSEAQRPEEYERAAYFPIW